MKSTLTRYKDYYLAYLGVVFVIFWGVFLILLFSTSKFVNKPLYYWLISIFGFLVGVFLLFKYRKTVFNEEIKIARIFEKEPVLIEKIMNPIKGYILFFSGALMILASFYVPDNNGKMYVGIITIIIGIFYYVMRNVYEEKTLAFINKYFFYQSLVIGLVFMIFGILGNTNWLILIGFLLITYSIAFYNKVISKN